MHRLHIQIVRGDGRAVDITPYVTRCRWDHGRQGPRSLELTAPLALADALELWDTRGLPPDVIVSRGPARRWRGRLRSQAMASGADGTAITLRAEGYVGALTDTRHTALWSDTRVGRWRPVTSDEYVDATPEKYALDTNNRLYIAPKKNETFSGSGVLGIMGYETPHQSSRPIVQVTFTYLLLAAAPWTFSLQRWGGTGADPWTFLASDWSITAGGALSATVTVTLAAPSHRIAFRLFYGGGAFTYPGDTGTSYARITGLRVRTSTATITAGAIAQSLLGEVRAINGDQLSASTSQIVDPGLDLTDVIYEDARPLDVLQEVAARGDGNGTVYECGVDMDRRLFLRPRDGMSRRWFVCLDGLDLERSIDRVQNRVYALYRGGADQKLRTPAADSLTSIARIGVVRSLAADADTSSLTQAALIRDVMLADHEAAGVAAGITPARVEDDAGGWEPGDALLPGDTLIVRGIGGGRRQAGADQLRTFILGETAYDAVAGVPELVPEEPLPTLDVVLAQSRRDVEI